MKFDKTMNRRGFLSLAGGVALTSSGLLCPMPILAAPTVGAGDRRFLFIYCRGGWDTTYCFSPMFGNSNVDMEDDATTAELGGITFVDHPERPAVRRFFEAYGSECAVVSGIEVRSIAHEKAEQLIFTGTSTTGADDWATVMAAHGNPELPLPHVNVTGPSFTAEFQEAVVRLGSAGQLSSLLSGAAVTQSAGGVVVPSSGVEALEDAFALGLAEGGGRRFDGDYAGVLRHLEEVRSRASQLDLTGGSDLSERIETVLDCFEMNLSRCGIVQYDGVRELGWDTHGGNHIQSWHFEELFGVLEATMESLKGRSGPAGGSLADEVCVVVFSEMGRHPQINSHWGKDHWTFTSAMLIGDGVRGGQVVGGYDENFYGMAVDLASGDSTELGEGLTDKHFGATLLALAGVDWGPYSGGLGPISAVVE